MINACFKLFEIVQNFVFLLQNVPDNSSEFFKITLFNRRGGYDVRLADVNIIRLYKKFTLKITLKNYLSMIILTIQNVSCRQMQDEEYIFKFRIESPLRKTKNITRNNPELVETSKNAHNITIDWKNSMYQNDLILDCVTSVVIWQNISGIRSKYVTRPSEEQIVYQRTNCFDEPEFHLNFRNDNVTYFR